MGNFSSQLNKCNAGHRLPDRLFSKMEAKCHFCPNFGRICHPFPWGGDGQVSDVLIASVTDAAGDVSMHRCTRGVCVAAWHLDSSCYQRSLDTSGGY